MKLKLINYFESLFHEKKGYSFLYRRVIYLSALPDVPAETGQAIYIVRGGNTNKWVVFKCPNNCGRQVEVNLMRTRYPNWRLSIRKKKVTLYPSIIVEGCNAHFWLNNNGVLWARDNGEICN